MTPIGPIHPGEDLTEILEELDITQTQFAKVIGVSPSRINRIINCLSPITAEMAVRIGYAFRMSAETWVNLQQMYDLEVARATVDVSKIEPLYEPLPDGWEPPLESEEDAKRRDAGGTLAAVGETASA